MARRAAMLLGGVLLLLAVATSRAGGDARRRAASAATQGRVQAARIEGTLLGPLAIDDLRYRDTGAGVDLAVDELRLDLAARALLRGRVHARSLALRGVDLRLSPGTDPPDDTPPSLDTPVNLQVDRLQVADARIQRKGATLLQVRTAGAQFAWTDAGVDLRRFEFAAPQGEASFAADVGMAGNRYTGRGQGRFSWQAGKQRFAGAIEARGDAARAELRLRLAERWSPTCTST